MPYRHWWQNSHELQKSRTRHGQLRFPAFLFVFVPKRRDFCLSLVVFTQTAITVVFNLDEFFNSTNINVVSQSKSN